MDREKELSTYNHSVNIVERKNILISGVKKVDSFDEEEFLVETVMGYLVLKGEGLELIKLDTLQGTVSIKGLIKSFDYIDDVKKDTINFEISKFDKNKKVLTLEDREFKLQ